MFILVKKCDDKVGRASALGANCNNAAGDEVYVSSELAVRELLLRAVLSVIISLNSGYEILQQKTICHVRAAGRKNRRFR